MHKLVELLWGLVVVVIFSLIGVVKALIPGQFFPKKSVKGQQVLVTGAGSGLGRLLSIKFAKRGANLVLWDIDQDGNEKTAKLVKEQGAQAFTYTVDLSKKDAIFSTADQVKKDVGNVDILVNNAGIVTGRKFLQCPDHLIQRTMDVNTMAHFWTVKAFLPFMMKKNHGHVVNIASGAGFNGVTGLCDYCASKFAAVGFDESLRNELQSLGKDGVHTTVICPYFIDTGMFDGVESKYPHILPILPQEYATDKMMEAILINQRILMMPKILYFIVVLKSIVPAHVYTYISNLTGVNDSMTTFIGRAKRD